MLDVVWDLWKWKVNIASYKGIDVFPIYKKCIEEHFEEGYEDLVIKAFENDPLIAGRLTKEETEKNRKIIIF